jgi:DNA uptake protein ComE-like DNA-binding protein
MLMGLPGMTDDVADAILDWIDADSTPRTNGAESEFYASLTPAYAPRNGPPVTIDELLSVRGVTPQLLFGLDAARMGLVPRESVANGNIEGVDNSDGSMDHGWAAYLTLWSAESSSLKPDGTAKIDLNGSDMQKLHDDLVAAGIDDTLATFIVAYRAYGASTASAQTTQAGPAATSNDVNIPSLKATANVENVLDLVGVTVEVPDPQAAQATQGNQGTGSSGGAGTAQTTSTGGGNTQKKYLKSPLTEDGGSLGTYLPQLLDNATTQSGSKSIAGRININQAPRLILMCVPGITSEIADQIIGNRVLDPLTAPDDQRYEVWPLIEGLVPLKTMKALQPYVTAGGHVYRAQVIGFFDKGGPVGRLEVVFDSTQHPTKLLFWKDVSRVPGGFPVESTGQGNVTNMSADY